MFTSTRVSRFNPQRMNDGTRGSRESYCPSASPSLLTSDSLPTKLRSLSLFHSELLLSETSGSEKSEASASLPFRVASDQWPDFFWRFASLSK